jgi:regulation of enolase protein 1 (concanavalin A-like superfamily)
MHYALDGKNLRKVRRFRLPLPPAVQVGLASQSPGKTGTTVDYLWFSVEARTVVNPRTGV